MAGLGRNLVSWQRAGVLIAATPTLVRWLERLVALPSSGWFKPDTAFALGGDLRAFHSAARLAVEGGGAVVYDATAFMAAYAGEVGGPFVNPPPFLAWIAPLGWLSFEAAWFVVAALSVVALFAGLRLLGVKRLWLGTAAALLFAPVYFAITFGQWSALWFVILAATYALLRRERQVAAGVVSGLLIMKPSLAAGLVLWWLLDWRRYRMTASAALAAAAAYLAASYLLVPDAWVGYVEHFPELIGEPDFPTRQWAQFSPWSSWELLFPTQSVLAVAAGMTSVAVVLAVLVPALRRATSLESAFAIAMLVTVLATPYLIAYDWTLLIIPAVLLWRRSGGSHYQLWPTVVIVAVAAAWSTALVNRMLGSGEVALQVAPLVLLALVWRQRRYLADDEAALVESA